MQRGFYNSEIEISTSEIIIIQNHYYICAIILKGCLALSNQTERQAEIKPIVVVVSRD
jgi:hypothetical protein